MTIEIENIYRYDRILREIERLSREKDSLVAVAPQSIEQLAAIYTSMFTDHRKVYRTRIFIFVALYLHDPAALTGRRMRKNIRSRIASVLELANPETVSMRAKNLLFHYMTYKDFREEIENFVKYI